jgi:hypothetical protein
MSEEKKGVEITDEEIQKALDVLGELETADDISKSIDEDMAAMNKEIPKKEDNFEKSEKQELPTNTIDTDEIVKSLSASFDSKFQSLARINKYLVDENESLKDANEEIRKSLSNTQETLEKVLSLTEEMANSPINRLGSFKKANAIERFEKSTEDGKEQLSITRDKRKILNMISKSLDTEEGQRRLSDVVPLVENGLVNQESFGFIKKSLENEIGGNFTITI